MPNSSRLYPRLLAWVGMEGHASAKTGLELPAAWQSSQAKRGVGSGLVWVGWYTTSLWPTPTLLNTTGRPRHPSSVGGACRPVFATVAHSLQRHLPSSPWTHSCRNVGCWAGWLAGSSSPSASGCSGRSACSSSDRLAIGGSVLGIRWWRARRGCRGRTLAAKRVTC